MCPPSTTTSGWVLRGELHRSGTAGSTHSTQHDWTIHIHTYIYQGKGGPRGEGETEGGRGTEGGGTERPREGNRGGEGSDRGVEIEGVEEQREGGTELGTEERDGTVRHNRRGWEWEGEKEGGERDAM